MVREICLEADIPYKKDLVLQMDNGWVVSKVKFVQDSDTYSLVSKHVAHQNASKIV